MNDLISRQAAISIPVCPKDNREYQTMNLDDAYELGWYDCQKCIEDLPSVQPDVPDTNVGDTIYRQAAIEVADAVWVVTGDKNVAKVWDQIKDLPSAQPEIIRCKDCKFYSPMNRETKTGICNLIMHQNFGDNWFCAGAERRTDE